MASTGAASASQKDSVKVTEDSTDDMCLPEVRSKVEHKKCDELRGDDFRVGKFAGLVPCNRVALLRARCNGAPGDL